MIGEFTREEREKKGKKNNRSFFNAISREFRCLCEISSSTSIVDFNYYFHKHFYRFDTFEFDDWMYQQHINFLLDQMPNHTDQIID